MEKGHFHEPESKIIESLGFTDEQEIIEKMPIPAELPKAMDLSGVPLSVLRSSTIEALINQNEDLMARLGVSLRRSSQIEDKMLRLEKLNTALSHKNEVLKDQILVLQEKDKVISERAKKVEATIADNRSKIQLLETQYAELYSDNKEKQRVLLDKIEILSNRTSRLLKYRKKIQTLSRNLRDTLFRVESDFVKEQELNTLLKSNITDLTARIQSLGREAESNQRALVNSYEDRISEQQNKISQLEKRSLLLDEKVAQIEELYSRKIELENLLVSERRGRDQQKNEFEKERSQLQKDLIEFRAETKSRLIEAEGKERVINEMAEKNSTLRNENARLIDQVESLQALWKDGQTQFERQTDKNQALQALNQQLSTSLNQYRKEIQALKATLTATEELTAEKLRQLQGQVQFLSQVATKTDQTAQAEKAELSEKITNMVAEIQSGFSRKEESSDN